MRSSASARHISATPSCDDSEYSCSRPCTSPSRPVALLRSRSVCASRRASACAAAAAGAGRRAAARSGGTASGSGRRYAAVIAARSGERVAGSERASRSETTVGDASASRGASTSPGGSPATGGACSARGGEPSYGKGSSCRVMSGLRLQFSAVHEHRRGEVFERAADRLEDGALPGRARAIALRERASAIAPSERASAVAPAARELGERADVLAPDDAARQRSDQVAALDRRIVAVRDHARAPRSSRRRPRASPARTSRSDRGGCPARAIGRKRAARVPASRS